jgi:branched-chain amino acid transport system permease protein
MGIEMMYHLTLEGANGSVMSLFRQQVDTKNAVPWVIAGALLVAGIAGFRWLQPRYHAVWSDVNAEIVAKQRGSMV